MQKPEENQHAFYPVKGRFWLDLQWLDSDHILLALEESHEDSRRHSLRQIFLWEPITGEELLNYHRQLFMWRLRTKASAGHSLSN